MTPRKYQMTVRAAAKEETRRRIVDATVALHAEQGIMATSWDEIARRAGVSVPSVYRHFPSLNELASACGKRVFAIAHPPTPDIFAGVRDRARRVERLVAEVFACYERGGPWIANMYRERFLKDDLAHFNASREALVRAAVGAKPLDEIVWLAVAMTDFWVWKSLVDRGLSSDVSARLISNTLLSQLEEIATKDEVRDSPTHRRQRTN